MPRTLACVDYDETTSTCHAQAWIEQASVIQEFKAMLPTVDQANAVGVAYFGSIMLIAAMAVLKPRGNL